MLRLLLRMNLIQKIPILKPRERRPYITTAAALVEFLIYISITSFVYLLIEKSNQDLFGQGILGFLKIYFEEGIYFSMTTATTVGYGDYSPTTIWGKVFVILFLFIFMSYKLVNLLTHFATGYSEVQELKKNGKLYKLMKNHLILYFDAKTVKQNDYRWIKEFKTELELSTRFRDNDILLVNSNSKENRDFNEFMALNYSDHDKVKHANVSLAEDGFFDKISIESAEHIFVLADPEDPTKDSITLDFAIRVEEETAYNKKVTAEVTKDEHRRRMVERAGVDVVMRPNRAYPGMIVSGTIGEGTVEVIEELLTRGKDSLEVFNVNSKEFLFGKALGDISMEGIGTIVAIIYNDGRVDPNPKGNANITDARKIIIMIENMNEKSYNGIQKSIDHIFSKY
tara:strand:- start:151024 stop:152214 length:1191 start_codon:yes stop_codon:yes gene_type:complete